MANKIEIAHHICISLEKNMKYRGIFLDGNPLDYIIPLFIFKFFLIILLSKVIYIILRPLRQPKIVCNILAGLIIGTSGLGRNETYMAKMFPEKENLVDGSIASLGIFLFSFLICIKIDVAEATRTTNKTCKISLVYIMFSFLFTITSLHLLTDFLPPGYTHGNFPIQFSLISSMSFFMVIVPALDELNLLSSELGQLSTSIVMLTEAFNTFIAITLSVLGLKETQHRLYAMLGLGGLITFTIFVVKPILNKINDITPKGQPVKESYVVGVIVWTLFSGVITDTLGVGYGPAIMGMGLIIPTRSPLATTIIHKCELLIFECFYPLFFIRIGHFVDLSKIHDWGEFVAFGAVVLVGILGRVVGCCLVSSSVNIKKSVAIFLGLILSLPGVPQILTAKKTQKLLSDQHYSTSVLIIVVVNATITPIIEILYKDEVSSSKLTKFHSRSLGMTSLLGELRIISCVQDESDVPSIINLLEALNPEEVSPISAYIIHLVSLATQTLPILAPYKNHKIRHFGNGKPNDSYNIMRAFVNYTINSKSSIQINPFRMVSPIKYMHEPICRLAEDIATPLIIVPFFKCQEAIHINDGTLRSFNTNIQSSARCTVGILVDRRLRKLTSLDEYFSYNVAVIFLGGADGREALAFAARMSRHPNISITVLKINMIGDSAKGFENERDIDDAFLSDFMAMNIDNACVICHEFVVQKTDEVIAAIHSLENDYDIVVVGKRQGCNSQFEIDLLGWAEYPELGVLGDAIAAPDFCGGVMSILVLQHYDEEKNF